METSSATAPPSGGQEEWNRTRSGTTVFNFFFFFFCIHVLEMQPCLLEIINICIYSFSWYITKLFSQLLCDVKSKHWLDYVQRQLFWSEWGATIKTPELPWGGQVHCGHTEGRTPDTWDQGLHPESHLWFGLGNISISAFFLTITKCWQHLSITMKRLNDAVVATSRYCIGRLDISVENKWLSLTCQIC